MTVSLAQIEPKALELRALLEELGPALIAYSGGVDSAYLAHAALEALGPDRVLAVTGRSPSYPAVQREMALRVAESIGLPHLEIETDEMDSPDYVANTGARCFFCKTELYGRLTALARRRGLAAVLDGTNADDLSDHRPGARAARQYGVRSPLQEVGLTKAEIRALSKRAGLPTWEAPAAPCLASRLAYGVSVTPERLGQVERAESALRELRGWKELRVRHHGVLGRIEVAPEDLDDLGDELLTAAARALVSAGFDRACLDLTGYRRGALNEALRVQDGRENGSAPAARSMRQLSERGVDVTIEAEADDTIAIVRPKGPSWTTERLISEREAVTAVCHAAGFRFVAAALA